MRALPALIACLLASPAAACDTALVLAVDVSGSISMVEYHLQMDGLAEALLDPAIIEALVKGHDRLAVVQWSGDHFQQLSLPWQQFATAEEVTALAEALRVAKRPPDYTDTAIGNAIRFATPLFADVPDCARHVIDVSGDGAENDGMTLPQARAEALAAGIILNGLAIEIDDTSLKLTEYYRLNVIGPTGFVMTAKGLEDFPRAIRAKLLRELTKAVS